MDKNMTINPKEERFSDIWKQETHGFNQLLSPSVGNARTFVNEMKRNGTAQCQPRPITTNSAHGCEIRNMNYNKLIILILAASAVLMSCKENGPSNTTLEEAAANEKVSYKLTAQESAQVDASNALGLDVLRSLVVKEPERSTVVSPSGIRYNLSMLASGAGGSTLSELQKAIGAGKVDLDSVNALNRRMMIGQQKPTGGMVHGPSMLTTINTFEDKGINISEKYRSCIENSYFATVSHSWGIKHTAILTNKTTFKALWMSYFHGLKKAPFQTVSGDSVEVTMMENSDDKMILSGMSDSLCSVVRLPYDGQFSMVVILPAKGSAISTLLGTLTVDRLKRIQYRLHHYNEILIHLPVFTTKVKNDLKESLANLGYRRMFIGGKANFSQMNDSARPLYVEKMTQDAEIAVDQYGTTATAETISEIEELSAIVSKYPTKLEFYADRPFFYAIYDAFGNICFCGVFTGK